MSAVRNQAPLIFSLSCHLQRVAPSAWSLKIRLHIPRPRWQEGKKGKERLLPPLALPTYHWPELWFWSYLAAREACESLFWVKMYYCCYYCSSKTEMVSGHPALCVVTTMLPYLYWEVLGRLWLELWYPTQNIIFSINKHFVDTCHLERNEKSWYKTQPCRRGDIMSWVPAMYMELA